MIKGTGKTVALNIRYVIFLSFLMSTCFISKTGDKSLLQLIKESKSDIIKQKTDQRGDEALVFLITLLDMIDSEEDKKRFEKFYRKYYDYVINISKQRLQGNHYLAEDNCSLVFETLAKNFNKIKDIDSPETKGYVYTVANGLAINMFYKEIQHQHKNTVSFDENYVIVQKSDITFDLYSVMELKSAVEELTEEEKTYFRLKHIYGLKLKEIGKMFDESESTVSRKLQKITKKLRERLDEK